MRNTTRAAAIAGAVAAATASVAAPASAHPSGAVFVQTNGLDGNAVVAYDGGLHRTGTYPTGGRGGLEAGAAKCASKRARRASSWRRHTAGRCSRSRPGR